MFGVPGGGAFRRRLKASPRRPKGVPKVSQRRPKASQKRPKAFQRRRKVMRCCRLGGKSLRWKKAPHRPSSNALFKKIRPQQTDDSNAVWQLWEDFYITLGVSPGHNSQSRPRDVPKASPRRPKGVPRGPKGVQRRPKGVPKASPRRPKVVPKASKGVAIPETSPRRPRSVPMSAQDVPEMSHWRLGNIP